jgi:hypothetical protein
MRINLGQKRKKKKKKVGLMVTDCQEILLEREGTTKKKGI